jgi:glutathione S-transferase
MTKTNVVKLHQAQPAWGVPNISPPCMELETWLRIAGIPYVVAPCNMAKAPKGKVPYIDDGTLIGDVTLIIEHLTSTTKKDPDLGLTPAERAVSLAFRRMMKDDLYWVLIHNRWVEEHHWALYRVVIMRLFFSDLSEPEQVDAVAAFREAIRSQLRGQGMARHTAEEIYRFGIADLRAVSDYLGDKPFLLGDRPTTADAAVYSHVANMIEVPLSDPVKEYGVKDRRLVMYCERMRERFFPDCPRQDDGAEGGAGAIGGV